MKIFLIGLCMLGEMGPDCLSCTDFCEAGDLAGWEGREVGIWFQAWERGVITSTLRNWDLRWSAFVDHQSTLR